MELIFGIAVVIILALAVYSFVIVTTQPVNKSEERQDNE